MKSKQSAVNANEDGNEVSFYINLSKEVVLKFCVCASDGPTAEGSCPPGG